MNYQTICGTAAKLGDVQRRNPEGVAHFLRAELFFLTSQERDHIHGWYVDRGHAAQSVAKACNSSDMYIKMKVFNRLYGLDRNPVIKAWEKYFNEDGSIK